MLSFALPAVLASPVTVDLTGRFSAQALLTVGLAGWLPRFFG